jgi:hypothetical protein
VTFISIHSVIICVVFFGAYMRRTRLYPLNPGVTSRRVKVTLARNPGRGEGELGMLRLRLALTREGEHYGPQPGLGIWLIWPAAARARRTSTSELQCGQTNHDRAKIKANRVWVRVPHLGTTLGKARRGSWRSGWLTRRVRVTGELWRRQQSAREGERG